MRLQTLEVEILRLHNRMGLRNTLETARQIGERLEQAKGLLPRGGWLPWLKRVGIPPRTAQIYIQVSKEDMPEGKVSMNQFVSMVRAARKAAARAQLAETRAEALASGELPEPPDRPPAHRLRRPGRCR
jgi:hypothetical protein